MDTDEETRARQLATNAQARVVLHQRIDQVLDAMFKASLAEIDSYYSLGPNLERPLPKHQLFTQPPPACRPVAKQQQQAVAKAAANCPIPVPEQPPCVKSTTEQVSRKRSRSVSSSSSSSSSAKQIVFVQDETLNNFAQENRKQNLITLQRKCLIDDCEEHFTDKATLFKHLLAIHGVHQFRCLVINCGHSFSTQRQLTSHLKQLHSDVATFDCIKCGKQFNKYDHVAHHIYSEHAVGLFGCATEGCNFSATLRAQVARHFETTHRAYVCPFAGCARSFTYTGHLRTHERTHLQIKPFGCRWAGCGYISENKSHVLAHIRNKHFKRLKKLKAQSQSGNEEDVDSELITDQHNVTDYLHVDEQLLEQAKQTIEQVRLQQRA